MYGIYLFYFGIKCNLYIFHPLTEYSYIVLMYYFKDLPPYFYLSYNHVLSILGNYLQIKQTFNKNSYRMQILDINCIV